MAAKLAAMTPFRVAHPVESNAVFVEMGETPYALLTRLGWRAYRFLDGTVRFMCSWATTDEAVEALGDALRTVAG
jgi:threonine aldolase